MNARKAKLLRAEARSFSNKDAPDVAYIEKPMNPHKRVDDSRLNTPTTILLHPLCIRWQYQDLKKAYRARPSMS